MSDRGPSTWGRLRRRYRYRLDNVLSRGIGAPLLVLGGITLLVVAIASVVLTALELSFAGDGETSWVEGFWQSGLRLMDPGTMADDVGWWERLIALGVTIVGILIVGTLIGVIASGVEQRVEGLRRGRSDVAESGHVLILGASGRLPMVVRQLVLSRLGARGRAIVVLADDDSGELGDDIRASVGNLDRTRLVFRRGNPARSSDLARVGIDTARSVIVLADEDSQGDAGVVLAVLAAGSELGGFDRIPIVAELSDLETVDMLVDACGGAVVPVAGVQVVARYTAFALREPGLNQVVGELLDFRGADIHVRDPGALAGRPFGEIVFCFATARPIGRITPTGEVQLNPDPDTPLAHDDRLVLIAEDEMHLSETPAVGAPAVRVDTRRDLGGRQTEERILIIGWNDLGTPLLSAVDERAAPGSRFEVVYDSRLFDTDEIRIPPLNNIDVELRPTKNLTWRLEDVRDADRLTSIVLLGYRRSLDVQETDSRTLLNLMLLKRDLATRGTNTRVIVELLDVDNRALPQGISADDYVISDAIVSRVLSQVAEQPDRRQVMFSIYAAGGPSLHLIPAGELGLDGEHDFREIVAGAYSSGLLAIGWRLASQRTGELVLNPPTSRRVRLQPDDDIVVIG